MRVRYSILSVIVGLGGVALEAAPTRAGLIVGGDYAGANLTVATGDVLSGSFTNVGTFLIPSGVTAYVAAGVPLSITAANFTLAGILDASGAGYAGGFPSRTSLPAVRGTALPRAILVVDPVGAQVECSAATFMAAAEVAVAMAHRGARPARHCPILWHRRADQVTATRSI